MKITLTGSLGNISKPLTIELIQKGHSVTVISSKPERQKEIEALGAKAAIGTMEDADFLASVFKGTDAVYMMETAGAGSYFDKDFDIFKSFNKIANNYQQAILQSGVKRVVLLSSIGAHTDNGNGILAIAFNAEQVLQQLPPDVSITILRPVGFYYNLLSFIPTIKSQGVIVSNYGGGNKKPWVSPLDIATAIAEEITTPFSGRKVRYVASEEISCNEIASILGAAIGKPDLKWVVIPDEQMLNGMLAAGMNPQIAKGLVEMNASINTGELYEDYYRNRPLLGKVKVKDYAKDFAAVYNQKPL